MENLREIISANLVTLRKHHGYTQAELAKKIKYSDKAISRWEKGEVLPDVETLNNLAKIFNVSIEYLFKEHNLEEHKKTIATKNEILVGLLAVSIVWTIATVIFVHLMLNYNYVLWQAFVWAVPMSIFSILLFNKNRRRYKKLSLYLGSALTWTLIASVYLQFLSQNLWLIFIVGVPIQLILIVYYFLKPTKKIKED